MLNGKVTVSKKEFCGGSPFGRVGPKGLLLFFGVVRPRRGMHGAGLALLRRR